MYGTTHAPQCYPQKGLVLALSQQKLIQPQTTTTRTMTFKEFQETLKKLDTFKLRRGKKLFALVNVTRETATLTEVGSTKTWRYKANAPPKT